MILLKYKSKFRTGFRDDTAKMLQQKDQAELQ